MAGKKKKRTTRVSSGMNIIWKARQAIRRIEKKIARWKRNQTNPNKKSAWTKHQNPHLSSRHDNWNTSGLERHIQLLQNIIKKGPKRK